MTITFYLQSVDKMCEIKQQWKNMPNIHAIQYFNQMRRIKNDMANGMWTYTLET